LARRIVIIGGNAAGINAASFARKTDRDAEITIIERDKYAVYSRCGLPFVIAGEIPSFEDLVLYPPDYYKMMRIDLRTETTATAIDKDAKTVEIQDNKTGATETLEYDSLVLCTGARAWIPPIEGRDKKGVYMLRTIDDGRAISDAIREARDAVIIGAGAIGLEMAASLRERGLNVTVVELLPHVLPVSLDQDMARLVQKKLDEHGVRVITGKGVDAILGDERVKAVSVAGEEIKADMVIAATGVRANWDLAKEAGIELGRRGIKTDHRMMTSVEGIYAAGDCVENIHLITKQPSVCQLGTAAVRMGKVAGINAAGGHATFPGFLGSFVTKVFDLQIGATGLTERDAKRFGFDAVSGSIRGVTRAEYYPGGKEVRVKLVVDGETHRVIGGQVVGGEDVTQRVNAISLAIQAGMTIHDLARADTCYAPPLADVWEAIVLAADVTLKRL